MIGTIPRIGQIRQIGQKPPAAVPGQKLRFIRKNEKMAVDARI
jgi:hypothetical protein